MACATSTWGTHLGAGTLRQGVLLGVIRDVLAAGLTGVLHFRREHRDLSLRFVNGQVVSGSPGAPDRLGEILERCGVIEADDLNRAVAEAQRQGRRLGPVLCEMGLVQRDRIEEALRLQIRDVLFTVLLWRDGTFRFEPDDAPTPMLEDVTLRVSTGQLLLEAVRGIDEPEAVREVLGDPNTPLAAVEHPPVRLEGVTLGPADGYVLSRVDGTLTIHQILEITPLPAEEVLRSLCALLSAGVIEHRPRPRAPIAQPRPAPRPEPKPQAPTAKLPEPEATPAPEVLRPAGEMLSEGMEHLAAGRLWEASLALEDAVARGEGSVRQRAQIALARAYAKSPSGGKQAETALLSLIEEDAGCGEAYLELGQIYVEKGLNTRAVAAFRKALSLDPGDGRAAKELAALAPSGLGGLLGRLRSRAR